MDTAPEAEDTSMALVNRGDDDGDGKGWDSRRTVLTTTALVERLPEEISAAMENCADDDDGTGGEAAKGK